MSAARKLEFAGAALLMLVGAYFFAGTVGIGAALVGLVVGFWAGMHS